ncbi:hypothetical protein LQK89_11905 [Curtobacterium sp. C1]|uniref:hypothetical protein n=1 Tax=Curtobacterium TaxID=2034 RepID=UPI000736ADCA|nr:MULTISPECIES: hypothetical protein [Curtobacterium]KTR21083.1 hypothetical protein NS330_05595 [Curtobacterium citreum]UFU13223.1 hypothetical protein LQK89_11905 [Curtobacterium sp. C1]WIJ44437.1 hypothetical protein QPK07_11930 [Curtobacterium citreum]
MLRPNGTTERRFRGRILGAGTTSGVRIVVGMWDRSPFGSFTDVFLELADGSSVLLAPDEIVAAYVSGTYRFDTVSVVDVRARRTARGLELDAGPLQATIDVGGISPLGRVLRIVPKPIARDPRWLALIDPVARLVSPGSGTAGSAGNGRREYYGVTGAHDVTAVSGTWAGEPLGTLAPLDPPVAFGFASMPRVPQVVDVETTIREPAV